MGDNNNDFAAAIKNFTIIVVANRQRPIAHSALRNCAVKPNSSKNKVVGYDSGKKAWIVKVKAAAEKDEANKELLKFLKKETGRTWLIKSGTRSREKILISALLENTGSRKEKH